RRHATEALCELRCAGADRPRIGMGIEAALDQQPQHPVGQARLNTGHGSSSPSKLPMRRKAILRRRCNFVILYVHRRSAASRPPFLRKAVPMSIRNLDRMFAPRSVALIGARARAGSVGNVLLNNLSGAGLDGPVWAVNPKGGRAG